MNDIKYVIGKLKNTSTYKNHNKQNKVYAQGKNNIFLLSVTIQFYLDDVIGNIFTNSVCKKEIFFLSPFPLYSEKRRQQNKRKCLCDIDYILYIFSVIMHCFPLWYI